MTTLLGSLLVSLSMESGEFLAGSTKAQLSLRSLQQKFVELQKVVVDTGRTMTKAMTLPLAGVGAGVVAVAANFESAMNKVAISTKGTAAELEHMRKLALDLGKSSMFGAGEAADAMDMLAKNGLNARQIIEGAAKASIDLASAAGSGLPEAADAITDVMAQFSMGTSQLEGAVDQITGAVNQSKLSFDDFAYAIGQAGGVAGSSGVEFEDFNAAIAATSSLFSSGQDAGTSFKTFLLALSGNSDGARNAIEAYGLAFYDAQGNLRSMAEVAEELRTKLGGLNEQARAQVLTDIFGTDAMRTAIGLMNQGAAGIDTIKAKIAETDAAAQAAQRLKGFTGQLEELKGAIETLAIAIADTGLLTAITKVVAAFANFVSRISEASPWVMKVAVFFAAMAAAMGPVVVVLGTLAAFALPLFIGRLSLVGIAIAAIINPIGTMIAFLVQLVAGVGGLSAALAVLRTGILALTASLAPYLLALLAVAGVLYLIFGRTNDAAKASGVYRDQQEKLRQVQERTKEATDALATATGKAREQSIANAKALRQETLQYLANARAAVVAARAKASIAVSEAKAARDVMRAQGPELSQRPGRERMNAIASSKAAKAVKQAEANLLAAQGTVFGLKANLNELDAIINAPAPFVDVPVPTASTDKKSGSSTSGASGIASGPSAAEIEARFNAELINYTQQSLSAMQRVATSADERAELELRSVEWARRQTLAGIQADEDYNAAQKKELSLAVERLAEHERAAIEFQHQMEIERELADMAGVEFDRQRDMLALQADVADTQQDRKRIAFDILALEQEYRRNQLDMVVASKTASEYEKKRAQAILDSLGAIEAGERASVGRSSETDIERWVREADKNPAQFAEARAGIGLDGINGLIDGLSQIPGKIESVNDAFKAMRDVFQGVIQDMLAQLIRLQLQKALAGIVGGLFGAPSGGTGFASVLAGVTLPGFAKGTNFAPGGMAIVGERGPELVNLPRGSQVIPNHELGGMGGVTMHVTNNFPNVTNANEARPTSNQASVRMRTVIAQAARKGIAG